MQATNFGFNRRPAAGDEPVSESDLRAGQEMNAAVRERSGWPVSSRSSQDRQANLEVIMRRRTQLHPRLHILFGPR